MKPKLILGSGSPRRRELLAELGYIFEVVTSDAEELHDAEMEPRLLCEENAKLKAVDVSKNHPDSVVLGSDTLVFIDQTPLGKPKSKLEAKQTLQLLAGRSHSVCSGVCLVHGSIIKAFSEVTKVHFKQLTDEDIDAYIDLVDVMDKAGSYAIQEHGDRLIERFEGDFSNVVGLPQARVDEELRHFGLQPEEQ